MRCGRLIQERLRDNVRHRHFCDFARHDWYCEGLALRPAAGDTEPFTCMCLVHRVPMKEGDHSGCPVELLACPEHLPEQQQVMREAALGSAPSEADDNPETGREADGHQIVGFCLWCGQNFYSYDEVWAHNANNSQPDAHYRCPWCLAHVTTDED